MKGYQVVFGPSPEGFIGGGDILGFVGPGEPGERRRLDPEQRRRKRAANKRRRRAVARGRRSGR